jgi:hypothetical protein
MTAASWKQCLGNAYDCIILRYRRVYIWKFGENRGEKAAHWTNFSFLMLMTCRKWLLIIRREQLKIRAEPIRQLVPFSINTPNLQFKARS